ncbi:hypothetical protein EN35_15950 [Rhodococcus qingshengii]|nr:hypothetical protein EN35_15950 [Rhodococcus qingshengii]
MLPLSAVFYEISPPLHHRTTLLKIITAVISATHLIFVYMSKRCFNDIRWKSFLIECRTGDRTQAV